MHTVIAKTNVKEVRQPHDPCCTLATSIRPFNQQSVKEKQSKIVNLKVQEKIKQVKGRERIQMLGKYVHVLNSEINSVLVEISTDLYGCVLIDMSLNTNKASAVELKQQIEMYEQGIKRKRNATKSRVKLKGMLVTPEMGGKIVLSVLHKGKGHIDHVCVKMDERGIEPPMLLEKMK